MPPYRRLLVVLTLAIFSSPLWADDPPAPAKQPITEEEAREFGQEFARRFAAGDAVWLSDRIDVAGMMWQATKGEKDVSARVLRTRASRRIQGASETVRSILPKEGALVSFQLKRVQNVDGVWKGLFRLIPKTSNFNLYELDFVRKKNGELGHGYRILILGKVEQKRLQDVGGEACSVAFASDIIFDGSVRGDDGHCQSSEHG